MEYYSQRIQHHAKNAMSIENGETGLDFFTNRGCDGVAAGSLAVYDFAEGVESLCYSTDFYAGLKSKLTPNKLQRILEELAFIQRPMQGSSAFLHVAQRYTGFRSIKIVLLDSLPARKVTPYSLPEGRFSATPHLHLKFHKMVEKPKNLHTEMVLMAYLLGYRDVRSEIFPYIGVSKKTCLLCGHMLQEIGCFKSRANHGKCYAQWTFPNKLWTYHEMAGRLETAVRRLKDILWIEVTKHDGPHRDAEKESAMVAPISPTYGRTATPFNSVVEDPKFLARETEWLIMTRRHSIEAK